MGPNRSINKLQRVDFMKNRDNCNLNSTEVFHIIKELLSIQCDNGNVVGPFFVWSTPKTIMTFFKETRQNRFLFGICRVSEIL